MNASPEAVIRRYVALTATLQSRVIYLEAILDGLGLGAVGDGAEDETQAGVPG